jgi:hypothetical protein
MAKESWFQRMVGDPTIGNIINKGLYLTPLAPLALANDITRANTGKSIPQHLGMEMDVLTQNLTGDPNQLAEIEKRIKESESSPYNTYDVSQQGKDYYKNAVEDYNKFKLSTEYGLSQAEKDLATGQFAKSQNFAQQNALNQGGGNLAPYINTVLNSNANDFSVNLAAKDAEVQRQKRADLMGYLNSLGKGADQFNQAQGYNFQKQTIAEQALGQAKQDFLSNKNKATNDLLKMGTELISLIPIPA